MISNTWNRRIASLVNRPTTSSNPVGLYGWLSPLQLRNRRANGIVACVYRDRDGIVFWRRAAMSSVQLPPCGWATGAWTAPGRREVAQIWRTRRSRRWWWRLTNDARWRELSGQTRCRRNDRTRLASASECWRRATGLQQWQDDVLQLYGN